MNTENLVSAFNEMFDFVTDLPSGLDGFDSDFDEAFEELKNIQSDNVQEVRYSHWQYYGYIGDSNYYKCCNCGEIQREDTNYCPSCGCRMEDA